ncbi:MAG: hypothetical protein KDK30_07430 [Leptospiraceae bacterium]|nr:hypothetical protein [Leptospiraceae bacterium]MCB1315122.1 hypothetical protein [Leptospiraceae bacterium]MCB1322036.1 hypothetical protein [Leptospiraceae bacterium]
MNAASTCDHEPANRTIRTRSYYSFWGWFALLFGVTVLPTRIDRICRRCGTIVTSTTDPEELRKEA